MVNGQFWSWMFTVLIVQALCKRTLNIVEALSEKHSERMRFYLSKVRQSLRFFVIKLCLIGARKTRIVNPGGCNLIQYLLAG